ncbi:MAG: radical SAM protein [Candidatus Omnitrophota bacterium]
MKRRAFSYPRMVYSDSRGRIFVHPEWQALGFDGRSYVLPESREWIPVPRGSAFFLLPGHRAFGLDPVRRCPAVLDTWEQEKVFPVSVFLIPGYMRLYLPAAQKSDSSVILPLWPYTALGYEQGRFFACATLVDKGRRQKPGFYRDKNLLRGGMASFRRLFPSNRLITHLSRCAWHYNCRNAQNLFLRRWEAGLPVSPACNSRCLGCLSFAQSDCVSSHERIRFVPTAGEISEIGARHLEKAVSPLVSFGQGCEGEPLLQSSVIAEAILKMRKRTRRGTIHMNTNGSDPRALESLARAGLNSVRISLNSLHPHFYEAYYRPCGYGLKDVLASIRIARSYGLFVSLNYLTLPGFSDSRDEVDRLVRFLKKGSIHLLQMRNLCIDPGIFQEKMPQAGGKPVGLLSMIEKIRRECPGVRIGYFNPPRSEFGI